MIASTVTQEERRQKALSKLIIESSNNTTKRRESKRERSRSTYELVHSQEGGDMQTMMDKMVKKRLSRKPDNVVGA